MSRKSALHQVRQWSTEDVVGFVASLGIEGFSGELFRNGIDGSVFIELVQDNSLKALGFDLTQQMLICTRLLSLGDEREAKAGRPSDAEGVFKPNGRVVSVAEAPGSAAAEETGIAACGHARGSWSRKLAEDDAKTHAAGGGWAQKLAGRTEAGAATRAEESGASARAEEAPENVDPVERECRGIEAQAKKWRDEYAQRHRTILDDIERRRREDSEVPAVSEEALLGAAEALDEKLVCKLLAARANPNVDGYPSEQPLYRAVTSGAHSIAALLLRARADLETFRSMGGMKDVELGCNDALMLELLRQPLGPRSMQRLPLQPCSRESMEAQHLLMKAHCQLQASAQKVHEAQAERHCGYA